MYADDVRAGRSPYDPAPPWEPRGRGLTGVAALLVLTAIALVAGIVDVVAGDSLRLVFSGGLVLGTVVAALLVARRDILMIVFAPPLVYVAASALAVLLGRGNSGGGLIDAATGWLVYGFPAMASATAAAVVIAAVRAAAARR